MGEGVAVSGSYAYVADGSQGLRIIDISDPENPVETGYLDTSGFVSGVAINGGNAYVADGSEGLRIIDVSDPTAPTERGFYDIPGGAAKVMVTGNYAHVSGGGLKNNRCFQSERSKRSWIL